MCLVHPCQIQISCFVLNQFTVCLSVSDTVWYSVTILTSQLHLYTHCVIHCVESCLIILRYMALGIALRYILDALRKSPDSKTFMFGITALDKFKTRLKEYPQYCQHLASIPHLSQFPERLIEVNRQSPTPSLTLTHCHNCASVLFVGHFTRWKRK